VNPFHLFVFFPWPDPQVVQKKKDYKSPQVKEKKKERKEG